MAIDIECETDGFEIASGLLDIADELSSKEYSVWRKAPAKKGQAHYRAFWLDDVLNPQLGLVSHVERSSDSHYLGVWAARFILFDEEVGAYSTYVKQDVKVAYTEYDLDFLEAFEIYLAKYHRPKHWAEGLTFQEANAALDILQGAPYSFQTESIFLQGL